MSEHKEHVREGMLVNRVKQPKRQLDSNISYMCILSPYNYIIKLAFINRLDFWN